MKRTCVEITILLLIAVAVIFYRFNQIPLHLALDEVEIAKLAISLDHKPYTPFSPLADGHATLYPYILLGSFKLFGISNLGLRLPVAVFAVTNVLLLYALMRMLFAQEKSPIPFLLAFLMATLRWSFNFARFSFEMPFLLMLELMSLYSMFLFAKKNRFIFLIFSSVFAGLAYNSYQPGRIFFLIPLIILIVTVQKKLKPLVIFTVFFLITITPLTVYLATHQTNDIRIKQELYFNNPKLSPATKFAYLWSNIQKTALMFHFAGDNNGRHNYPGKPALNPIIGILFIAGLIIALKDFKKQNNRIFLSYFLIALFPTLLTLPAENPNMLRTYTAIPSIIYFVGLSMQSLMNAGHKLKINSAVYLILWVFLLISAYSSLRTYFVFQPPVTINAFVIIEDLHTYLKINHIIR